tara:strand:- start:204 stop:485 length:282 start_codon:yes stop_codon:yes gene_type:complete
MKIEVMMFAGAKEATNCDSTFVEFPSEQTGEQQGQRTSEVTAKQVLEQLAILHPALAPILPSCRLAVDDQYVTMDFAITPNHEVALIPPVSGG